MLLAADLEKEKEKALVFYVRLIAACSRTLLSYSFLSLL